MFLIQLNKNLVRFQLFEKILGLQSQQIFSTFKFNFIFTLLSPCTINPINEVYSMVIDNSKVIDISPFSFKGQIIPLIHANCVSFSTRTIGFTMSHKDSIEKFVAEVLYCH